MLNSLPPKDLLNNLKLGLLKLNKIWHSLETKNPMLMQFLDKPTKEEMMLTIELLLLNKILMLLLEDSKINQKLFQMLT
jgi:hypothetical protein